MPCSTTSLTMKAAEFHTKAQALLNKTHDWKTRRDAESAKRDAAIKHQAESFDPIDRAPFIRRMSQIAEREVTNQFRPELEKLAEEGRALQEVKRRPPSQMTLLTMWAMKEPATVAAAAALVDSKGPAECDQMARQQLAEMQDRELTHADAAILAVLMTRVGRLRREERPFDPAELANAVKIPGYDENAHHLNEARRKLDQFEREWVDLYRAGSLSGLTKVRNAIDAGALDRQPRPDGTPPEGQSSNAKIARGLADAPSA